MALLLRSGEKLRPAAAAAAAGTAARQPHRLWWWAADGHLGRDRSTHREDLGALLAAFDAPLPDTAFRPEHAARLGGFGRHRGPAFAYARACRHLADGVAPGRIDASLVERAEVSAGLDATETLDRATIAEHFADLCLPRGREAIWAACRDAHARLAPRPAAPAPRRARFEPASLHRAA